MFQTLSVGMFMMMSFWCVVQTCQVSVVSRWAGRVVASGICVCWCGLVGIPL